MMPLGAPSISKYASLVQPDAQIVALRVHCTRTALKAPPYAHCSLDKGIACAQHIQLPTHTCACAWYECTLTFAHISKCMQTQESLGNMKTFRFTPMGECLPGARPARYFSINYPDFSPRFTLSWISPLRRPHCNAHLAYKVRCIIKQYM